MTALSSTLPVPAPAPPNRLLLASAGLLVMEALLIAVPLAVLGEAVNWPAGLGEPAAVTLPLVAANETAMRWGYLAYLGYSLLFLPVIAAMLAAFADTARRLSTVARLAVSFAALSTLARAIGILRWLTAMPALATTWDSADPQSRQSLSLQYQVLNDFGGGIGELLGVAAFGAAAVGCATLAVRSVAPRWLTWSGVLAAGVAAGPLVQLAGVDADALTSVGVAAVHLWFLASATVLVSRARASARRP